MIIVVEGPDGAGKTTLCGELSRRLNIPIFKPTETPLKGQDIGQSQAQDSITLDMLDAGVDEMIFDRFFPSEYAYGKTFSRRFDEGVFWQMDERLWRLMRHRDVVPILLYYGDGFDYRRLDDEVGEMDARRVNDHYMEYQRAAKTRWVAITAGKTTHGLLECAMQHIVKKRPSNDVVFMELAKQVARRSTCLSRRNGSVAVSSDNHVIATGYNGSPRGMEHPKECPRLQNRVSSGEGLEMCNDVHAEENVVAQAALYGHSIKGGRVFTIFSPCHRCARMLINAQVKEVVYLELYGDVRAFDMFEEVGLKLRQLGEG